MDPIRPVIRPPGGTPRVDAPGAPDRVERKSDEEREREQAEERERRRRSGRGEVAPPDPPPDDGRPHIDIRI